jgi:outer membrane protein TolC
MSPAPYRGIVALLWLAAASAWAERPPGASVDELLAHARQHSPELAAMRLESEAAGERAAAADALPDPLLRTELRNFTNEGSGASPSLAPSRVGSTKYTLIQPLPWWGKRDLKRAAAESGAEEARQRTVATWADLAARIKTGYARYYQAHQQLQATRELRDLAGRLEAVARVRYGNGLAPQADAIRAMAEGSAMDGELLAMETEAHHGMLRINGLLGRPPAAALADPEQLRPLPPPERLDPAALEARLRQNNPQLFAEAARIRAAEGNRDLAYRNRYPDLALGVSPIQTGSRVGEWELMLEVTIPLQQASRRSQEREAERLVESARARREAAANQLLTELAENLEALNLARRQQALTERSLLPQAELNLQAAIAGYENGKVDFAALLDAQRQIRRTRLELIRNRAEQQARLADIERLVGEDL